MPTRFEISSSAVGYPESVSVRRCADGTYIFYALTYVEYKENGEKVRALCSLRSDNLRFGRDLSYSISLNEDTRSFNPPIFTPVILSRSLLHDLRFETINYQDVLLEMAIMNKGDGLMSYNIFETAENYEVQVNVPGFTSDEISVYLEDGTIRVKVKPKKEEQDDDKEVIVKNYTKAKQEIEVYLPNSESANAELRNGILYITAPKKAKGLKVEIKTA